MQRRAGFALTLLLALAGCGTISEAPAPLAGAHTGQHRIVFKSALSDVASANSAITPYYALKMSREAAKLCPAGYEKLHEGQTILPNDGSYSYWDIRCSAK